MAIVVTHANVAVVAPQAQHALSAVTPLASAAHVHPETQLGPAPPPSHQPLLLYSAHVQDGSLDGTQAGVSVHVSAQIHAYDYEYAKKIAES